MSWLKEVLLWKAPLKLVIWDTSQVETSSPMVSQPENASRWIGREWSTAVTPLPALPPISYWTPSIIQSALACWFEKIRRNKKVKKITVKATLLNTRALAPLISLSVI